MSFAAPLRQRNLPLLPLTSLIDILFLVLIFFMTTSVFREQDAMIDVNLPATETAKAAAIPTQITITVDEDNRIFIGEHQYSPEDLRQTLGELARQFPDEVVVIRGDRASRLQTSMTVLDTAYAAGLTNVKLGTTKAASEILGVP